jgi:hypothetical protein
VTTSTNSSDTKRFQAIPGYAPTTLKLIELLGAGKVGDVLPISTLNEAAGADVSPKGKNRHSLHSACRHVRRSKGLVWKWVTGGAALKCYNPSEIVDLVDARRKHIGRTARQAASEAAIAAAHVDQIDDKDRPRLHALMAQVGTLAAFSDGRTTTALVERSANTVPDKAKLLEAFQK